MAAEFEVEALTLEAFHTKVREMGVPADETVPAALPTSAEEQWALLTPYVGKPLREIPKGLVLLFTANQGGTRARVGRDFTQRVRALPPRERMVFEEVEEEAFI